jgi:hypothetical protein
VFAAATGLRHLDRYGHILAWARRAEHLSGYRKLFPIRLVDFDALQDWECLDSRSGGDLAEEVRQYFIPDFTT